MRLVSSSLTQDSKIEATRTSSSYEAQSQHYAYYYDQQQQSYFHHSKHFHWQSSLLSTTIASCHERAKSLANRSTATRTTDFLLSRRQSKQQHDQWRFCYSQHTNHDQPRVPANLAKLQHNLTSHQSLPWASYHHHLPRRPSRTPSSPLRRLLRHQQRSHVRSPTHAPIRTDTRGGRRLARARP